MRARLLLRERRILDETSFAEMVIWRVPVPRAGSTHGFKYRLAYVVDGTCVLRFDNEAGKGDHKHVGTGEVAYMFEGPERLLTDFLSAVDAWRRG